MLVIGRRLEQEIEVTHQASGDVMKIVVCQIRGDQCKLGFEDAAKNFVVMRPERTKPSPVARPKATQPQPDGGTP